MSHTPDPPATPPLAYQIAAYFRMVYADDQPVSGPEGDAYGEAIDDLGEAIYAGLQTAEWQQMVQAQDLRRACHMMLDVFGPPAGETMEGWGPGEIDAVEATRDALTEAERQTTAEAA